VKPHHAEGSPFHISARTLQGLDRRATTKVIAVTTIRCVALVGIVIAAYYLAPLRPEAGLRILGRLLVIAVLIGAVLIVQLRGIVRSEHPGLRAIESLTLTVSLLVVMFASTYMMISRSNPSAFNEVLDRTSSLYFTMTTLATIGYGDIAAQTDGARVVVMFQMVFNVLVLGAGVRLIATTARASVEAIDATGAPLIGSAPPEE